MDKILSWVKMIFLEKHEVVYNMMMIIISVIVFVLIDWLRKAYKVLETGHVAAGDPEAMKKFSKDIDTMFAEAKNLTTNLNRKVDDLYARINKWDTQIITLQKGMDEMKKQLEATQRGGQSGKMEETMTKMQEDHKELFANINKRIEDLYDKTRRFNEWLINSQKQLEETNKGIVKVQGSLAELSKIPKETKPPEFDKFVKNMEENSKYVHKVNADIEHMHNKMLEHEDQINDLKRIFEDMDATFAEMNKRFQKIETSDRHN